MSNLATGPLCGTEWWCPVVANEHYLRWGILSVVSAWVMLAEWNRYQKTRPLIQLFQSKLGWCKGFQYDNSHAASLGMQALIGVAFQFGFDDRGSASSGMKWIHALIGWFVLIFTHSARRFGLAAPGYFLFTDASDNLYRVYPRSAQGPFLLKKISTEYSYAEQEFATVDELDASAVKPKSE